MKGLPKASLKSLTKSLKNYQLHASAFGNPDSKFSSWQLSKTLL
jgi:hypothetical protein